MNNRLHPIAMIIGFVFGGSLLSAGIAMLMGYSSTYEIGWITVFICGCVCAGIAQYIAEKFSKKKKQPRNTGGHDFLEWRR